MSLQRRIYDAAVIASPEGLNMSSPGVKPWGREIVVSDNPNGVEFESMEPDKKSHSTITIPFIQPLRGCALYLFLNRRLHLRLFIFKPCGLMLIPEKNDAHQKDHENSRPGNANPIYGKTLVQRLIKCFLSAARIKT